VSKFRMFLPGMSGQFNRRDFLRIGTLAATAPIFDVKLPHGLDFTLLNSPTPQKYLTETMPGGVALFDCNNDGFLDIFLVNGGNLSSPMLLPEEFDRANPRYWNRLYRQNKNGSFADVTETAGLSSAGAGNYGMGVAIGDYENHVFADVFVTNYGKNALYHNNGDGTFTDVAAKAGVAGGGWSVLAGFADFDNDGHLDLFVTRYMEWDTRHSKACGGAWQTYCPPAEFPGTTNFLCRNRGDGTFEDVSMKSGIASERAAPWVFPSPITMTMVSLTFLWPTTVCSSICSTTTGTATFNECALESGVGLSADGKPLSGMGTVFEDYDNDGLPDILVTELPREIYGLYHNHGEGLFTNESLETGLGALTAGSSGCGVGLEDLDNDGWKDLLVTQSHVLDNAEAIDHSLHYSETPLLALNHSGRCERTESGITTPVTGRGLAFGGLNKDGWLDAVLTVPGGHPPILMDRGGTRHWLSITLRGTRNNRDGLGARLRINRQTRFATTAGSYLSASDQRLRFGLGDSNTAFTEVSWPSGACQTLKDVPADQFLEEIREPEHP
jgi:enediyne biosynthesis protein E4